MSMDAGNGLLGLAGAYLLACFLAWVIPDPPPPPPPVPDPTRDRTGAAAP